jgi:FecR protein
MRPPYLALTVAGGILVFLIAGARGADSAAALLEKVGAVDTAKPAGAWSPATVGQSLNEHDRLRTGEDSRAVAKLSDGSVLRVDELTTIEILPPRDAKGSATLDLKQGSTYFFSRERSREVNFKTPAANGAIRGTEFLLTVTPQQRTLTAMLSGKFELFDGDNHLLLQKGDQGEAQVGQGQSKGAIGNAINSVQWYLLIETKLPPNRTVVNAEKEQFLEGLCDAVKKWSFVAPQVAKAAVMKRRELGPEILKTTIQCLGNDCGLIAQVVAAVIAADPTRASEYTDLAAKAAPGCVGAGEHGEGEFGNPPNNINPPPGSVGGGAGGNLCIVCHNGHEIQIACSEVADFLAHHPGDTQGACQPTPVTNP